MVLGVEIGGRYGEEDEFGIGFAKEQCFQFGVKELRRDGMGRGLRSFVRWVRYLSLVPTSCRSVTNQLPCTRLLLLQH